ncbi:lytic transglycosylase domain-containing protein [Acidovorax sp. JHL-3]|uniref:lytic transglycosylase domain-containing protein n=1 Tax=Acidovorax sp. JHL-3 TaxID=1276755 RepID=UPI0004B5A47C|nr:lytic transglycosylase domain-containing protein [Acidovorax sp. JHL-3]
MTASGKIVSGVRTFVADVTEGFLEITHNSFALIGLAVAFVVLTLTARPDLRQAGEAHLMDWLQSRQVALLEMPVELGAIERATASNPKDLPKEQAAVAYWLSKKYRVAPEPLSALVAEAYETGARTKIDPTLILAIMAIESSFNPFAQSSVGAQGLMQVMTRVHTDKYENFGGHFAAFDPVTNLRVGVKVLQECIARAGSVEGGLRYYVGAANLPDDGGYTAKVLAEHFRLRQVAGGRSTPMNPPATLSTQAPAPARTVPVVAPADAPEAAGDKLALL